LQQSWADALSAVIKGGAAIARLLANIVRLLRHLCDSPRKRRRQVTRSWILADIALNS